MAVETMFREEDGHGGVVIRRTGGTPGNEDDAKRQDRKSAEAETRWAHGESIVEAAVETEAEK
jgi:hypothetical protein